MQSPRSDWRLYYRRLAARLPDLVATAPLTLCLSNVCVDAICRLGAMAEAVTKTAPERAHVLFDRLLRRAAAGKGGEFRSDWAGGPDWLRRNVDCHRAIGGAGAQAAWALSAIGAPALIALANRHAGLISVLPAGVDVVVDGRPAKGRTAPALSPDKPEIFIFEFSAGETIAGRHIPRATRIIVRFHDPGLERDAAFRAYSVANAGGAVALISGLGSVPSGRIGAELSYLQGIVPAWRAAGLRCVHLELGGYDDAGTLKAVIRHAGRIADSLGMSASEFPEVSGGEDPTAPAMLAAARDIGVNRLCVHADGWAASVTLDDPRRERAALACGSLMAAARAENGVPASTVAIPEGARFTDPPRAGAALKGGWRHVGVATPYLASPAATIGLGDTFSAGCLLILGQPALAFD